MPVNQKSNTVVNKYGQLINFMLSNCRNTRAAYRLFGKAIEMISSYPPPSITTDRRASYPKAI